MKKYLKNLLNCLKPKITLNKKANPNKQYFFIDVPSLKMGKKKCIAMAYGDSKNIEEFYEKVNVPKGTLKWNDNLFLPERKIGVPRVVLEVDREKKF